MTRRSILALFAAFPALQASHVRGEVAESWNRSGPAMGCLWKLILPGLDPEVAAKAGDAVFAEISRLNGIFSDYEPGSELNRLCAGSGERGPVPVGPELLQILLLSRKLSEATGGVFDVTLGPCTRLWRRSRRRGELPDPQSLAAARNRCGWEALIPDAAAGTVTLTKKAMQLDLGGIAKGWTQDACLRLLQERFGLDRVLLDAAGEIAVGAPPPGRKAWQLGIPSPDPGGLSIPVVHANLATSGDVHQFVEIAGTRYSHIIDPSTGLGCTVSRQGTILAAKGELADPLAKVLCLMDPEAALQLLAERFPEVQARVLQAVPGQPHLIRQSSHFPESAPPAPQRPALPVPGSGTAGSGIPE